MDGNKKATRGIGENQGRASSKAEHAHTGYLWYQLVSANPRVAAAAFRLHCVEARDRVALMPISSVAVGVVSSEPERRRECVQYRFRWVIESTSRDDNGT